MKKPKKLEPGSRVALLAPAGPVSEEKIEAALARCRGLELEPVLGRSARLQTGFVAGPDEERAADLQWAVDDPDLDAIWALRGGYGGLRTLGLVDLAALAERPRAFIGFSDNTIIHLALLRRGLVSFHGPHAGAATLPPLAEACFRHVLMSAEPAGTLPLAPDPAQTTSLAGGVAEGRLVGGNLALVASSCGTAYQPSAEGRILFLEDVGEPLYRIDRMLMQLRLSGVMNGVAGLAFGRFTELPAGEEALLEDVLREAIAPLGVPAVLGLPFGHDDNSWTMPLGVRARLDADACSLALLEAAVE